MISTRTWFERGQLQLQNGDEAAGYESFGQSQTHLSRALDLDPSLLEAVFNRALIRQQLKLNRLAEEDWKLSVRRTKTHRGPMRHKEDSKICRS